MVFTRVSGIHRRSVMMTVAAGLLLTLPSTAAAQTPSPARPGHRLSLGVLGAANLSTLRVTGDARYEQRVGWATGAWMNIPVGRFISLEPQVQFSAVSLRQQPVTGTPAFLDDVRIHTVSAPVLLKLHLRWIALTAGGQIDVPISVVDQPNQWTLDDIKPYSAAVNGGVELFPRSRVTLYGWYSYGLTGVDNRATPDPDNTYNLQGVQAGVRIRLFGGRRGAPRPSRIVRDTANPCAVRFGLDRPPHCPVLDTDDDGLTDRADKCPLVPGSLRFEGCPPPDSDGDGLTDDVDACPSERGLEKHRGCAPPDQDRDGIPDEEDRCPTVLGARETMGCPRITAFTAEAVTFAPGSDVLTPSGRRELDKIVMYLQLHPDARIRLSGHTDNTGTDFINNPLSERRAESAKAYLVSRSIASERISTEGHGSSRPTMGNGTAGGRAKNRRVEATVR